jgi:hypothetical protein
MEDQMAKITLATFKSFVKRNRGNDLLIKCQSSFDGMTDCVEQARNPQFHAVQPADQTFENNLGINGIWLVGSSRDRFQEFSEDGLRGIHVYNCCGSFTVAIQK